MAKNVYLLEIEPGHRIDGDGWTQGITDYIWVVDYVNDRWKRHLCSDLSYSGKISSGAYFPQGACSDGTHLYLTQNSNDANDKIHKYLLSDLSLVLSFGSTGAGDDQFTNPGGICTDGTYLYIADTINHRIKKHKCSDLTYVAKIGSSGTGDDQFSGPADLCTDGTHVYVSDTHNDRLKKHKCSDLSFVSKLDNLPGAADNQVWDPKGICTDDTYLYIADTSNSRIKKHLCSDLSYNSKLALNSTYGIGTDNTYIYVSIAGVGDKIQKRFCSDLSLDSEFGSVGAGDDEFDNPELVRFSQEYDNNSYYIPHVEGEPSKVEEDGAALTERGSLALCNDNAGSWYWDSTNTRLYVHTTGSDDPAGYIIIAFFWEYLTNAQYTDEDIIFNGNEYLPYLNDNDIPDVTSETSGYQEGGTRQSFGSVRIINADGRYDSRLTDYIYEAKKIILKAGEKGDAYGDYNTYWIGWTGGIKWSEEEIDIDIEDLRTLHA